MIKKYLFIIGLLLPLSSIAACPLGEKEDHLTVQRVMRNFGRFIGDADYLCVKAKIPYETVTDAEISTAISKLDLVIDCASEVLANPKGDVLPSKLGLMTDDKEKTELVDDYIYFMTDFKDAVTEYRDLYKAVLAAKPAERDFKAVDEKRQDVDDLVNRAHKKL